MEVAEAFLEDFLVVFQEDTHFLPEAERRRFLLKTYLIFSLMAMLVRALGLILDEQVAELVSINKKMMMTIVNSSIEHHHQYFNNYFNYYQ
jgi:hypothetical protein